MTQLNSFSSIPNPKIPRYPERSLIQLPDQEKIDKEKERQSLVNLFLLGDRESFNDSPDGRTVNNVLDTDKEIDYVDRKLADVNNDGIISEEEKKNHVSVRTADKNKDGKITKEEYFQYLIERSGGKYNMDDLNKDFDDSGVRGRLFPGFKAW